VRDLITSTANLHVKRIRSLVRSRKERHHERMFVVEGVRLVEEALLYAIPASILYVPEQLQATPRGRWLLSQVEQQPDAAPTTTAILAELSAVESSQGIIAAVPLPQLTPATLSLVLVLDGVQDPGNVGTLLRSAEAAGVDLVVCLSGTADVWSPKVVRAAMGAHFRLPLVDAVDWTTIRPQLEPLTAIYAATQHAERTYDQVDWRQPVALVVGNEANGVSLETLQIAQQVTIPMAGAVESLNAGIAGSVLLFEAARQRRS
jgi:TrmH family RNA methyltransferase